jgi:hypothetical protein
MNVLPTSWNNAASPYLPLSAGESILSITPGNHLSPWAGLALSPAMRLAAALAIAAVCSSAATPSFARAPRAAVPRASPHTELATTHDRARAARRARCSSARRERRQPRQS